jgi:subtilisin family serine protease
MPDMRDCKLALLALAISVTSAEAQVLPDDRVVVARAVGSMPSIRVVQFVARNAQPLTFDRASQPDFANANLQTIVEKLCGSLQPGYLDELARLNNRTNIGPDSVLGDLAYQMNWPACLSVRIGKPGLDTYVIQKDDTLTGIRQLFTGAGAPDPNALNAFFRGSDISLRSAKRLQPGTEVEIPLFTGATPLIALSSAESFVNGLNDAAGGTARATPDEDAPGDIIGPVRFAPPGVPIGSTQGLFAECSNGDGSLPYPFDPNEVALAYGFARTASPASVNRVTVVTVDNGFFGAPCGPGGCPEMEDDHVRSSPRFPREFFDTEQFGERDGFGPVITGLLIEPLNYRNKSPSGVRYRAADVNPETGHGTHVAGLTLGGPLFLHHRAAFLGTDGKPWLNLVVVNIAAGQTDLLPGSDRNLSDLLYGIAGNKVINMSIAFDGRLDRGISATLGRTIGGDPSSLFVAAAGNEGGNLNFASREFYPARFGGSQGNFGNVVTVAAIDGPIDNVEKLSTFSNYSADYVDIAAPGCKIKSWLDANQPEAPVSGTSQAAPLVTFGATLLRSVWYGATPTKIKNRLLYSGDLLARAEDRNLVRSQAKLNIAKALTLAMDRVTLDQEGSRRTFLGNLALIQGLSCEQLGPRTPEMIRSIKRVPDGTFVSYSVDNNQKLEICPLSMPPNMTISFRPAYEIVRGQPKRFTGESFDIRRDEIFDIVRAR